MTDLTFFFPVSLTRTPKNHFGVLLVGSGSSSPQQVIRNDQLGQRVDTSDEWIQSRTGIAQRRVIGPTESLHGLAADAAAQAIKMANWNNEDVDLLVLATSTPDDLFGSATQVQSKLGIKNAVAFDLTAACSGFLFAIITAAQFLKTGSMKRALVIGADQLSRWVDWNDRRSCVLFGDGAGAIALESSNEDDGLIGFQLKSDGDRGECLNLPNLLDFEELVDGVLHQKGGFSPIRMNGQEVYKFAVREVPAILDNLLKTHEIKPQELNWVLLHQANQRILDAVAERFAIPTEKVLSNLSRYGNTSAATIPLMFDEAIRDGRIKPGHLIASSGFGAGLSWGAALFRWHGPA